MKFNNKQIAIAFLASTGSISLFAQSSVQEAFNPVRTAMVSQTFGSDARAGAMGDVGVATDPDVNSQTWNPAKYPFTISRAGISLNYTPWLRQLVEGIALINATGYVRLGDYQALSASIRYFTVGDVPITDGNSITVKPYEFAVDAAYSRMLSEKFSAAVALRYMYSDLSGHTDNNLTAGSAFAADIAGYYTDYIMLGSRESQLSFGLNISNIGSKINFGEDYSYFIPTNLRLGAGLLIPINDYNKISFNVDINKLLVPSMPLQKDNESDEDYQTRLQKNYYDISSISGIFKSFGDSEKGFKGELEEINWGLGAEYTYNDRFSLRAGYHHESEAQGNRKFFSVGAGFRMNVMSIDAGYVIATSPSNPLDQTLRVSLNFDMDGIRDLFSRK